MSKKTKLLVVDISREMIDQIIDKLNNCSVSYFSSIEDANDTINKPGTNFNLMIVNPGVDEKKWIKLIRTTLKKHFGLPVYLYADFDGDSESLKKIGVQGALSDKEELIKIINEVSSNLTMFNFNSEVLDSQKIEEKDATDQNLTPVLAEHLLSGKQAFFDIFVKLNPTKFIKIIKSGDDFEVERINKYLKKGLTHFYITKESQKHYIKYCDMLTSKILSSQKISNEVKVKQTLNLGDQVIGFLKENGLNKQSLNFCQKYSENLFNMTRKIKTSSEVVRLALAEMETVDHGAITAIFAGLIANKYGIFGQELLEVIGVASCIHDIGLIEMKRFYKHEYQKKFIDEFYIENEINSDNCPDSRKKNLSELFIKHPEIGSQLCSKIENISPLIPQIVYQHHMRNDGSGFPEKQKGQVISPHSEIIGIADEFSKIYKRFQEKLIPQDELITFINNPRGFSGKVKRSFQSTITPLFKREKAV